MGFCLYATWTDTVSRRRHVYAVPSLLCRVPDVLLLLHHLASQRSPATSRSRAPTVASPACDGLGSGTWSLNRVMHQPRPGRLEPLLEPSTGAGGRSSVSSIPSSMIATYCTWSNVQYPYIVDTLRAHQLGDEETGNRSSKRELERWRGSVTYLGNTRAVNSTGKRRLQLHVPVLYASTVHCWGLPSAAVVAAFFFLLSPLPWISSPYCLSAPVRKVRSDS
ncbi:uncharacterized protein LY79DRAFT_535464, partial [Colletotrichum navitas]